VCRTRKGPSGRTGRLVPGYGRVIRPNTNLTQRQDDNPCYDAIEAFTRHLDPRLGPRVIQSAEINGRRYHVLGGQVSHAVVNPTFDPVSPAGALSAYFRGNVPRAAAPWTTCANASRSPTLP
jgi:hypothetical protein